MKNKIYAYLLSAFLFVCIVYPAMWWFSLGRYEKAEHWLEPVFDVKLFSAGNITSRKIIISSGSNSLFGIDSLLLESYAGLPVINLAGHAGLTLDFYADQILKVVSSGDVVIMPLEHSYYSLGWKLTDWQIANMESWGADHIKNYSYAETLRYLMHSDIRKVIRKILFSDEISNSRSLYNDYEQAKARTFSSNYEWNGYNLASMNHLGDILVEREVVDRVLEGMGDYSYFKSDQVDPYFLFSLLRLKERVESHGASLYLTWPTTIRNEAFDLSSEEIKTRMSSIEVKVRNAGINIICGPEDFHFEVSDFFNTNYHLSRAGAKKRTSELFACLQVEGIL